jgi:membrane protein
MANGVIGLIKESGKEWVADKAPRLSAATAYYTILSLAPLLVISVSIAGLVFGKDAARSGIEHQFESLVGRTGAVAVQQMLENASEPSSGAVAITVGLVTLLLGASGVFGELQDAFNTVWNAPPKPDRGIWGVIQDRFLSFAMVLCVGFLLLVSLVLSTAISGAGHYLWEGVPGLQSLTRILELFLSLVIITVLFALMFKYLPDCEVPWREAWTGASVTAGLFTLGKYLIGLYLGKAAVASPYGAAGSVVALVVWVYYSAMILFFGAELTQVLTRRRNPRLGKNRADAPAPLGTY